ncbi:MAG TPA: regulatory iron-sulfur-containing complex subunit RicT [Bacteroidales bacterium]|nr:regulatory iron-sulfur-containing complex subunit RicT [Bacteroidales bacterium]HPB24276.1 regulatory iron-sulfur-containing complex subunit RicT [Bacteroidales bacterium]HPI28901.1 regulatory iron-sulfur-containing complex subunit RicT [Bacteroidales bacterium]HQN14871.1 regulatory iron-sulfur-containing complex subunit RicT [Bacteroidales bacterium]HQP14347.1 regulatory iron-sulfur-containing complex subunit RicT [Bacteroidales bacterium]
MTNEKNEFLTRGCDSKPKSHQKNDKIYSHSCCKRNAYDWLKDINPPKIYPAFPYVEVRFKNSRKDFFLVPENSDYKVGDIVAVESSPGHDLGIITLMGEAARLQMKKKRVNFETREIKKVYRRARPSDIEKWVSVVAPETETLYKTKKITGNLHLSMKVNDVEYQGDGTKATFYYTAEERVDFRELIKVLAEQFGVRVEMRQIGVRQEASSLGGIGTCGRELCCSSWLFDFKSVSTNTARVQQMSINPQKLAGQCSKLKCCLNYEYDCYVDALKEFPNTDTIVKTKKGNAQCQKIDVIKKIVWYSYVDDPANLLAIGVDVAKKIIKDNAKGIVPEKLEDFAQKQEKKIEFEHFEEDLSKFADD